MVKLVIKECEKRMKKYLLSIAALLFLFSLAACGEQTEMKYDENSLEGKVEKVVYHEISHKVEKADDKERVVSISTIQDVVAGNDNKIVNVELNADEYTTSARSRDEILIQSSKLFEQLFQLENVSEVSLDWKLPLTDVKGNEEPKTVVKIILRADNGINWDNFVIYDFEKVADKYYEHKALK